MKNEGASKEAIQFHYDVGNGFFAPWLGPTMVYSAALWPDAQKGDCSLDDAQVAKLDWHLASANVERGGRLLDVGCGWGSLLRRAIERAGIEEGVGLTLSDAQADWIRRHDAGAPITVEVRSWQALADTPRPFDGIVSIGAFEHFARPEMDRAAKVRHYEAFFRFCAGSLASGGRLSLQTIVWMNIDPAREVASLPLDFFPESNLPHVGEVVEAAGPHFHLMAFHNRPRDYSRTLRQWFRSLSANAAPLGAEFGEDTVKRYLKAFAGFVVGFDSGQVGLTRYTFLKR